MFNIKSQSKSAITNAIPQSDMYLITKPGRKQFRDIRYLTKQSCSVVLQILGIYHKTDNINVSGGINW